jgi:hypothetical protein
LKRNRKKLINYIAGPLLFILLGWSLYVQMRNKQDFHSAWQNIRDFYKGPGSWKLWVAIALCYINWGLETVKWQALVRPVQQVSFFKAYKAVLSGLSMSLFMPNRSGEYIGRVLYMDAGNRLQSIPLTIIGSISQMLVTMITGVIGLFFLWKEVLSHRLNIQGLSVFWTNVLMYGVVAGAVLLLIVYYRLSWLARLLERLPFIKKYAFFIQKVEDFHWRDLTRILILSFSRYVVFTVQYLLLLSVFKVEVPVLEGVCAVAVLFLFLSVIPTPPLAELGLRGEAGKQLFGLFSSNYLGIVCMTGSIWFINLILPSIAGTIFILGVKIFKPATTAAGNNVNITTPHTSAEKTKAMID